MNEKLRKLEEEFVRVVYGEEVLEEIEKMDAPKRPTEYSESPDSIRKRILIRRNMNKLTPNQKKKYKTKSKDSFTTKLNLYVFDKVIQETESLITLTDYQKFKISKELRDVYTTKYWQWKSDSKLKEVPSKINYPIKTDLTIGKIYDEMKHFKSKYVKDFKEFKLDYIERFGEVFSEKEFKERIEEEHCHYCNLTNDMVDKLVDAEQMFKKQDTRGWSLEIDRKDSNLEYTFDNTVMCCYWCNNAKTDEFTEEEFRKVGEEIKQIWKKRLEK
jgi:5-methylcytosine-specific restriction endonuclease McrA